MLRGMGHMVERWSERRGAMRVAVQGTAVMRGGAPPLHGVVENLSRSGALVHVSTPPADGEHELELQLPGGRGTLRARTVRIAPTRHATWSVALAFERVEPALQQSIDASVADAVRAARARLVIVLDDDERRRARLVDRLVDRGFTPLAPRTPLETIDLLASPALRIRLCLVAADFRIARAALAQTLAEHFPWVTAASIDDDLDGAVDHAVAAYSS
jgi:hypothetical protein